MNDDKNSFKPAELLLPYIDRYFVVNISSDSPIDLFPILPGTGVDIYIHYSQSFSINKHKLPETHIVCSRKYFQIELQNESLNFIAIRFKSGAFRYFCPVNFHELNNTFISLEEIWKQKGADLVDKIRESSLQEQIMLLDNFFLTCLKRYGKQNLYLDSMISELYYNPFIRLEDLAEKGRISIRHFERCFKNEFGINPKKFQRIARFQASIKKILLQKEATLPAILDEGYYDHSHFIKECIKLTGNTPSYLLNDKDTKYHFYKYKMK